MITDETVDRVREAADIAQIIGEQVKLKRRGKGWRGPCPFHQGTHENFAVDPAKGLYHCFVCGESGDVFTFVQKHLGLDFPAAVKYVGDRSGVVVQEVARQREGPDPRQPLWDINATAADYFRSLLWDDREGAEARNYLSLRRVSREVADRFGLGYSPRDPEAMRTYFNALGTPDELLREAGLLVAREDGGELRARFRHRLIFPIQDATGNHVGFGGRLLGPGEPKYLNSAESRVFSKARLLYGLHMAKHAIRRDGRALVVEGYFDVVRLVSAGFDWVVAPLGTALTDDQAALLRRYASRVFLLYDSDRAGLRATFRAGDQLLRLRAAVQVVTLPEGEDPDSFVDKFGGERLTAQLADAVDIFERKMQTLQRSGYLADLSHKRRALDKLLPTLRAASDPLTRDLYITRTSEMLGVGKSVLEREVAAEAQRADTRADARASRAPESSDAARSASPGVARPASGRRSDEPSLADAPPTASRALLHLLVQVPDKSVEAAEQLAPDELRGARVRELYRALLAAGATPDVDRLAAALSPEAAALYRALLERRKIGRAHV